MKKITLLFTLLLSYAVMGQPTSAPPTPTEDAADVISLFSDAYTAETTLTPTTFGQSSNSAAVITAAGNDVYEFTIVDGDFQGFQLGASIDLTVMENLHYDIWIEGTPQPGAIFNTTVSYHAGGHLTGQTTGYVDTNALGVPSTGTWLSFDVPFSDFAPDLSANPRDIISELVFSYTNATDTGPIYVDNIYFWRTSVDPNADATLSDLTLDGSTISGFSSNTLTYNEELPNGTTTAPTVAGVATQAGMGSSNVSVTQASGVPGTATVDVTAPDGTTMLRYTVNFTEAPDLPTTAAPDITLEMGSDALIVYSDTSPISNRVDTNVTNFNFNAFSGAGVIVTEEDIESNGNNAGKLDNLGFYGAQWDAEDVSTFTYVHIQYYASSSTTNFNFFLIDATAGIPGGNPEEPRYSFATSGGDATLVTGAWTSVFIPLSHFTNFNTPSFSYDLNDIFQWKFDSTVSGGLVYFDNIFFSTTNVLSNEDFALAGFNAYPNPSTSQWNISSANSLIDNIEVFNILGKQVQSLRPNALEASIDASGLANGIYFARVSSEGVTRTVKLVKQ